ncbi:MAG TPA: hypothetical protein VH740_09225 [Vicinamibacterales bacterium]
MKKGLFSVVTPIVMAASFAAAMPARSSAQTSAEQEERRKHIRYMEGVLMSAVRIGAEQFGKELEKYDPGAMTALMGTPRARGFLLDGHGVFFDVEVPDVNQSFVWSVMTTQRDRQNGDAIDSLQEALRSMPEGATLSQARAALRHLSSTVGPIRAASASPQAAGQVVAAVPPLTDPRKQYQEAVVSSVVDAMLGYSVRLNLGPDEWLTVAARGNDAPLTPSQGLADTVTITVRVKGSDLATYHSDPARRDEIRQKVKLDAKVF